VTITRLTPWRFPGTSTEPEPVAVGLNNAVVGCGRPLPRWSQTSYTFVIGGAGMPLTTISPRPSVTCTDALPGQVTLAL
jgi:hypothetical protein